MIADPAEPGYRYPARGERLWHEPSRQWVVVVAGQDQALWGPDDEVLVTLQANGSRATMKLRSLREEKP